MLDQKIVSQFFCDVQWGTIQISNNKIDTTQYRKVVGWLEGVIIRFYKIEDREGLNDLTSDTWLASYQQVSVK